MFGVRARGGERNGQQLGKGLEDQLAKLRDVSSDSQSFVRKKRYWFK